MDEIQQTKSSSTKIIVGIIIAALVIWGWYMLFKKGPVASKEPVKIGFIGPLTGDAANIGQNVKAAVDIAVKEVNDAGGINGRPLDVIYEDGQCSGVVASNAANKLINIDKVPIILGGACSGETSAFVGAAKQSKTVVLSYCSSAPALSQSGEYFFRDYPSDLYQGSFAANYAFNKLGKRNVGVLYVKSDWGVGIKEVFEQKFKELGGQIVAEQGYEQTSRDLRAQLTKIKSAKPELVYFLGYTEASVPGLKQAAELGLKVPMLGGDAWDDSKIWTGAGAAGEGAMYTVVYAPLNDQFKSNMKAKIGNDEITVCTPEAYDAVKIIAQAITKAGDSSDAIKNGLRKASYTGGISSGKIEFDGNGDLVGASYIVKIVKNGKATEAK